ncbi:MAG: hypothetical protein ACQERN_09135 [Thermodesulfobacteriota bacterium]
MPLPEARVVHRSAGRLRIRIPEKRDDTAFFSQVEEKLRQRMKTRQIAASAATAGVLITDAGADAEDKVKRFARSEHLFELAGQSPPAGQSARRQVYASFCQCNETVKRTSRDNLDLPVLLFVFLVGSGIYQLLRYGFRLPPWYTAFWYALGIFTKSLVDENGGDDDGADAGGDDGGE